MVAEKKPKKPPVDWEAVEREYLTGFRSLRDIGDEFGCSEGAIRKKAKQNDWSRNLSAKINAKADALVRKDEVRKKVRSEGVISEKEQISVASAMLADKVLGQRDDVQRARSIVNRLWELVDIELEHPSELAHLGEMLRSEDEFGQDKLNDLYRAAIGLPQQIKNVKLLADALKVLIELERKVLKIDSMPDQDDTAKKAGEEFGRAVTGGVNAAMSALAEKVAAANVK